MIPIWTAPETSRGITVESLHALNATTSTHQSIQMARAEQKRCGWGLAQVEQKSGGGGGAATAAEGIIVRAARDPRLGHVAPRMVNAALNHDGAFLRRPLPLLLLLVLVLIIFVRLLLLRLLFPLLLLRTVRARRRTH